MVVLPAGVLFLVVFFNNILFIQVDPSVREAFICISRNNDNNDTWPSTYKRMNINKGLFIYGVDDSHVKYKLKLFYFNQTSKATEG